MKKHTVQDDPNGKKFTKGEIEQLVEFVKWLRRIK